MRSCQQPALPAKGRLKGVTARWVIRQLEAPLEIINSSGQTRAMGPPIVARLTSRPSHIALGSDASVLAKDPR